MFVDMSYSMTSCSLVNINNPRNSEKLHLPGKKLDPPINLGSCIVIHLPLNGVYMHHTMEENCVDCFCNKEGLYDS